MTIDVDDNVVDSERFLYERFLGAPHGVRSDIIVAVWRRVHLLEEVGQLVDRDGSHFLEFQFGVLHEFLRKVGFYSEKHKAIKCAGEVFDNEFRDLVIGKICMVFLCFRKRHAITAFLKSLSVDDYGRKSFRFGKHAHIEKTD